MSTDNGTTLKDRVTHAMLWQLFFAILVLVSCLAGIMANMINFTAAAITAALIFVSGSALTIVLAWTTVPQEHVWLLEVFGKYRITLRTGLHFIFPYLGFVTTQEVYLGEQQMKLFMDESVDRGFGFGDVEFRNISARVEVTVYFKFVNPFNVVYRISNVFRALEEKMDSTVRSYLGRYTIDEANVIKVRADLSAIMNGDYIDPEKIDEQKKTRFGTDAEMIAEMQKCELWNRIYRDWGVMVTALALSDIVLTKEVIEARQTVLLAEKRAAAAVFDKDARITKAEGERKGLSAEGEGIAKQVELLIQTGLDPASAAAYLANRLKWENVGTKGSSVIIESGESPTGFGARFAAGFNAANKQTPPSPKGQPDNASETTAPATDAQDKTRRP